MFKPLLQQLSGTVRQNTAREHLQGTMARPAARCNAAGLTACLALCAASVIFFTTVPQQLLPWGLSGLQSVTAPDLSAGSSAKAWKSQAATAQQSADAHAAVNLSFSIRDDKFIKDGAPFRIISGSIHYHRCTYVVIVNFFLIIKATCIRACVQCIMLRQQ